MPARPIVRVLLAAAVGAALPRGAVAETIKVSAGESIQAALDVAVSGDVVLVGKGVYTEPVTMAVAGVTLKGSGAILDAEYAAPCVTIAASDVTVTNMTLANGEHGVLAQSVADGGLLSGLVVHKNTIAAAEDHGILLTAVACTITSNDVSGCRGGGIAFAAAGPGGTTSIEKNTVTQCRGEGIEATGAPLVVQRNTVSHCEADGLRIVVTAAPSDGEVEPQAFIARNRSTNNGREPGGGAAGSGLVVEDLAGAATIIDKNTCSENAGNGIEALGLTLVVNGNRCDDNNNEGLRLRVVGSLVTGNRAQRNHDDGIDLEPLLPEPPPPADGGTGELADNTATGNVCQDNFGDGLKLAGSGNTARGNKCSGNMRNGLRVTGDGATGVVLDGNTCTKNGHQGITDSAEGTDMTDNKCTGNGAKLGPDIAGTGNGDGSVGAFAGNVFDTGGSETPARLDG